jgi:putative transposase
MDWFARRILAWQLSIAMEAAYCVEVLEAAQAKRDRPQIFNTDQGTAAAVDKSLRSLRGINGRI